MTKYELECLAEHIKNIEGMNFDEIKAAFAVLKFSPNEDNILKINYIGQPYNHQIHRGLKHPRGRFEMVSFDLVATVQDHYQLRLKVATNKGECYFQKAVSECFQQMSFLLILAPNSNYSNGSLFHYAIAANKNIQAKAPREPKELLAVYYRIDNQIFISADGDA